MRVYNSSYTYGKSKFKLLLFTLIFFSNIHAFGKFRVVLNLQNPNITLKAFLMSSVSGQIIDSASLFNGAYTLTGQLNHAELMNIYFMKSKNSLKVVTPIVRVFVENSDISIQADYEKLPDYRTSIILDKYPYEKIYVSGSKSHELLSDFYKILYTHMGEKSIYLERFYSFSNNVTNQSLNYVQKRIKLIAPVDSLNQLIDKHIVDFIYKHSESDVAIFVAQQYLSRFPINVMNRIYSILDSSHSGENAMSVFTQKKKSCEKSAVGAHFLNYEFRDPQGRQVKLENLITGKHKYILLDFWASWCEPCRSDFSHLKRVYEKYHKYGIEIIGISIDEKTDQWKKALSQDGTDWLALIDPQSSNGELPKLYGFNAVPQSILISPDGIILDRQVRGPWLDKKLISLFGNRFDAMY